LTYLGTGCIYEYDGDHPMGDSKKGFSEEDSPNFFGSQYSTVKGVTDQMIRHYRTTLNARIRMPITSQKNNRNFITKIASYKKKFILPLIL